jgi:N-acetyl-1-D-myo-inositol-2-amino-2-deoxy-alpha-D-glucopyranoside deacetylase
VVDDVVPSAVVVDPDAVPAQERALRAHATQVVVGEGWFALSNRVVGRLAGREGFARVDLRTGRMVTRSTADVGRPAGGPLAALPDLLGGAP